MPSLELHFYHWENITIPYTLILKNELLFLKFYVKMCETINTRKKHTISFPENLYFIVRHCCFLPLNYINIRPLKHLIIMLDFPLRSRVKTGLVHCTTSSWALQSAVYMTSRPWNNALHCQLGRMLWPWTLKYMNSYFVPQWIIWKYYKMTCNNMEIYVSKWMIF